MRHLTRPSALIWTIALLAGGLAGNLWLGCGMNLVAFAVVAALTLRFRVAAAIALGIWFESQLVGFTLCHYPHDPMTFAWGAALGAGTLVAGAVAACFASRSKVAAFLAAFAAYEVALFAFAVSAGSEAGAFTLDVVAQLFSSNALVALSLAVLYFAVGALEVAAARVARSRRQA